MYQYNPPARFGVNFSRLRKVKPGLDLSAAFLDDIKSIGEDLFVVFHPFKLLWEGIVMNGYYGAEDDPRFTIHEEYGEILFGWALKKANSEAPLEEGLWHLWLMGSHGYSHLAAIESKDSEYLKLLVKRLALQSQLTTKYGQLAFNKLSREEQNKVKEKQEKDRFELFQNVQKENSWLMKKAYEEAQKGNLNPTNPTKDVITSYSNQTDKSRIVRPLEDKEGGLVI